MKNCQQPRLFIFTTPLAPVHLEMSMVEEGVRSVYNYLLLYSLDLQQALQQALVLFLVG